MIINKTIDMERKIQKPVPISERKPEAWKDIIGYEGFYQISNHGKVRSILRRSRDGHSKKECRAMALNRVGDGYLGLHLYKDTVSKRALVHILVGTHFVANPDNKPMINHLFGDKTDNYYEHIEWATAKENINHAFDNGFNIKVKRNDPHRSKPVIKLDKDGVKVSEYPSASEAARQHYVAPSNIIQAIKDNKIIKGHLWNYK